MVRAAHIHTYRKVNGWFAVPHGLALVLLLFTGCASAPESTSGAAPTTETSVADSSVVADSAAVEEGWVCELEPTVTVRVDNRSTFDIQVTFGSYRQARAAESFSRTTYQVARYLLRSDVRLEILRGGLQVGGPAVIHTEPVFCNIATLVIGSRPEYSFFYGDELRTPKRGDDEGEGREDGESAEEAPADSALSESAG